MLSNNTKKQTIQNLKEQIYYQKLSIILGSLIQWKNKKQQRILNLYHDPMLKINKQAQQILKTTINQAQALDCILQDQKQFFHHLKIYQPKLSSKIHQQQNTTALFSPIFIQINQSFLKKKQCMIQIKQFLQRFLSILSLQIANCKKKYQCFQQATKQLKHNIKQIDRKQADAINSVSTKKQRKIFDLKKIHQVQQMYLLKIQNCQRIHQRLLMNIKQMRKLRNNFLQNVVSNLEYFRKLYNQCFNQTIGDKLQNFYAKKIKKSSLKLKQDQQLSEASEQSDRNLKQQISDQLISQLHKIFQSILQQVSIRSWNIEVEKGANQKNHKKRNSKSYSIQHKKNQQNKKINKVKGHLTIDNKFLLLKGIQISQQIDLDHAQIFQSSTNNEFIGIKQKNRKHSQQLLFKFENFEREDQFKLHLFKMHKTQII